MNTETKVRDSTVEDMVRAYNHLFGVGDHYPLEVRGLTGDRFRLRADCADGWVQAGGDWGENPKVWIEDPRVWTEDEPVLLEWERGNPPTQTDFFGDKRFELGDDRAMDVATICRFVDLTWHKLNFKIEELHAAAFPQR